MIDISTNGGLTTSGLIPQSHQPPLPQLAYKCVDPTVSLIPAPEAREQQKQLIQQALKEGRLFLREIELNAESKYLGSKKREPRPFYKLEQGVNVGMRHNKLNVGILEFNPLACYKCDADTCSLITPNTNPDELAIKCLADLCSMQKKMQEQAERGWEIYPPFTSGHLHCDGTYRSPKLKLHQYSALTEYSELVSSGYEAKQIKCVCISKEDAHRTISDALREKQELEKTLGTGPLPLVVYSCKGGSIEVYFDEELAGNNLAFNEARLGDFSLTHNLSEITFRKLLNLLPMSLKSATLNRQVLKTSVEMGKARQEMLQLVENPDLQSYQRFQALKESGFALHSRFPVNRHWRTLLDLLIRNEWKRFSNVFFLCCTPTSLEV